ncbi:Uncharacterised protein [Mycobacterium tuberculosis]|nr:Uncharacterised protein [Mycobacterium tuberculosis]
MSACDFTCRVAVKSRFAVLTIHPRTVVGHPNELQTALFNDHIDPGASRIDCILDKLLHYRGRPFDHFARSDLVGDMFI